MNAVKSGKYDDYGMDSHRDWNYKNGKQLKEGKFQNYNSLL